MKAELEWFFKVEAVADCVFLGSRITMDGDCSCEIKTCMLLGRKVMRNINSVLKSRDITLLTKVCIDKAMVFPIVIYGSENWTIKKKLSTKELMPLNCVAGEDLRVPWRARSNQSILKKISPEHSLEGLMLKLKLQYFDHLICRADSLEKTLMLGKTEGKSEGGGRE